METDAQMRSAGVLYFSMSGVGCLSASEGLPLQLSSPGNCPVPTVDGCQLPWGCSCD